MLSRHYHGLVLYGSLHAMLSPSGASSTLCHVRFTFIMYSCAFTIYVYSCESCTLMFTEPSCIISCAPFHGPPCDIMYNNITCLDPCVLIRENGESASSHVNNSIVV
ncbi:hypothetical protein M6B38_316725 [Iris pallida]|uniref:Uncharacterized protein n=1 Tax=Iris pallida TaxID=29817 RepID=A0AAX6HF39_IRIPA|nr:hypothetical protein M6B38_316725 [Iris pallida]